MVVFESNLLLILLALLVIAALAVLGKPLLSRCWAFLANWWARDKRAEEEARRQAECRKQAEKELRAALHEETPEEREREALRG